MRRFLMMVAFLATLLVGCFGHQQVQVHVADSMAEAANAALPILVQTFKLEGREAIAEAKTEQEARQAIQAIEEKWKPVWDAWEALRIAEDAWATALEQGSDERAALAAVRKAYCGLVAQWPESVPAIPLAPIVCKGTGHE